VLGSGLRRLGELLTYSRRRTIVILVFANSLDFAVVASSTSMYSSPKRSIGPWADGTTCARFAADN
jgi:hypothetical protein